MKQRHILSALVVAIGVGGVVGIGQVQAQEGFNNTHPPIIQKLAQRFGLSETEVKAVFDEEHATHEAKMKAKATDLLTQLVTEGKLTEDQKTAIIDKQTEIAAQHDSLKESWGEMSKEERKAKMKSYRTELEAWAQEQGIDIQYLRFKFKGKSSHHAPVYMTTETSAVQK